MGEHWELFQRSPGRKRFYMHCNLISADRLCWQQATANFSPFRLEKWGYGTPQSKKWGYRYPSYPRKLRLCFRCIRCKECVVKNREIRRLIEAPLAIIFYSSVHHLRSWTVHWYAVLRLTEHEASGRRSTPQTRTKTELNIPGVFCLNVVVWILQTAEQPLPADVLYAFTDYGLLNGFSFSFFFH